MDNYQNYVEAVKVFKKQSAQRELRLLLQRGHLTDSRILKYLNKWGIKSIGIEKLVVKLKNADCTLNDAAFLRNCSVIKAMIDSGFDVDSKNSAGKTALFAAVKLDDLTLIKFLLNAGIDVNARDANGRTALFGATSKKEVLHLLLKSGANVNAAADMSETPLYKAILFGSHSQNGECIDLLLQYGAVPHNLDKRDLCTIFDIALNTNNANILVAQLALVKKMGMAIDKSSVIRCTLRKNQARAAELEDYYGACEKMLEVNVFRKFTLFSLMTGNRKQLSRCIRNDTFDAQVGDICLKLQLNMLYPYYYNFLMKRIANVTDLVKLENIAITVLCNLLQGNENEYHIPARIIFGYLRKEELERLIEI